ncbi:hypothetical protein [Streptomyces zagrosensis]|uniref:Lipoprotein n=1 Tax=Streptomyces zagrosensis TaxID=1042984 RepID=A0A7W9V0R3_9ACTN|nr:hypothetical protein [Streptomyces zagrosensis]MBB5938132.1 hypothetical protein [Streptomyces zagrosensis]
MRSSRKAARFGTGAAAAVGGLALLAGLTACGSDSGNSDKPASAKNAIAALQLASESTDKQHSAKVDGSTAIAGAKSEMSGSMDWSDGMRASMTITQHGGASDQTGLSGKPMEARYTPDAMFMNLGDKFASAPESGGKHWMKYDYATLAEKAGPSGKFLKDQMKNTDPARAVQVLIATGKVREVGKEDVRGSKTTHYTGVVNVSELAKMQSEDLSKQDLLDLQEQLKQSGMETETVDLWIGDDNLLVKKREHAQSSQGTFETTVFYTDYGTDVSVEEPPVSDTMNFEEALAQQGQ